MVEYRSVEKGIRGFIFIQLFMQIQLFSFLKSTVPER